MASLPTIGGDIGVWADKLVEWLKVAHQNDGTQKASGIQPTNPCQIGGAPYQTELGSGGWFSNVAYFRAKQPDSNLALDLIPSKASGGSTWIDFVDRDIIASGIGDYESLRVGKANGGETACFIGASGAGTGLNRGLIFQPFAVVGQPETSWRGVGIGRSKTTVHASAILDLDANGLAADDKRGLLFPRVTTSQRLAIPSPAEGLAVYDTTLHTVCFYNGTNWQKATTTNAD